MTTDQYQVLVEKIDNIQKTLDRKIKDDEDLTDAYQQSQIRLGSLEAIVDELRRLVKTIPQKTQDKVAEVTTPIIEETQGLKETIQDKKFIKITVPSKSLFRRLMFWR